MRTLRHQHYPTVRRIDAHRATVPDPGSLPRRVDQVQRGATTGDTGVVKRERVARFEPDGGGVDGCAYRPAVIDKSIDPKLMSPVRKFASPGWLARCDSQIDAAG